MAKDPRANGAVPAADGSRACAPYLRVVRGDATPEEVAALVATLAAVAAARASAGELQPPKPASGWTDRFRILRAAVRPGPGGWRRSALPRG